MIFDVYNTREYQDGKIAPDIIPMPMDYNDIKLRVCGSDDVRFKIEQHRCGQEGVKNTLPAICFVGRCAKGKTRAARYMTPTQFVMVDVDHPRVPAKEIWETIRTEANERFGDGWVVDNVMLVHETPSHGVHIYFLSQPGLETLLDNMNWFNDLFRLERFGDYDPKTQDFSRVSFAFLKEEILFENARLFMNTEMEFEENLVNPTYDVSDGKDSNTVPAKKASSKERDTKSNEVPTFTAEDEEKYKNLNYRGTLVSTIIAKYVETYGTPYDTEVHNYYNEMVKYFRNICDNDRKALLYLLPRFGHSAEECWGQIGSICRVNTLSSLPKEFYFFLKDNGFYKARPDAKSKQGELQEYMLSDNVQTDYPAPPYLPPIFKECVRIVPHDFVLSAVNGLLPILGTLTSFAKAYDKEDLKWHTTSFFSVIYAPAGTGKSFIEIFKEILFVLLKLRDAVQAARENLYLSVIGKKGANEKSPDNPHVSTRLIPAKCSEAELLGKMQDNKGYHMFTYAAEMDEWAKGARAAGGNKSDMIRIAWDNGEYGQQFKTTTTRGLTKMYWNVLIAGTLAQLQSYFKDVENGLVTRCSFSTIENQEYAPKPVFKEFNKRELARITAFIERCDAMSYTEPCDVSPSDWLGITDEKEFDEKIKWRFTMKPRVEYDLKWVQPTLRKFQEKHRKIAAMNVDSARDVFRRRVGVRGFRLALICMCLYERPTKADLANCCKFIDWWMERDLEATLKLWAAEYNEKVNTHLPSFQPKIYDLCAKEFTKEDLFQVCQQYGVKTQVRRIVFEWKKNKFIEEVGKNKWKKAS